ncbi:MAG: aspartyl/asparaginyl beta-hydroxylase domain-containing protein, partial [Gammaproteobacteria bacterium]|nr:aspartyl/asparaginyl beta-hydroxylase domain-containing protein [Gammaproteobacteria bacterium]
MTIKLTSNQTSFLHRLTKKSGKHFLRWAGNFQARHSLVSSTPVIANTTFPWVKQLENAYSDIRTELDTLLEHPEDIPTFHQISPDQKRISKGNN